MPQATAPILDSTISDVPIRAIKVRSWPMMVDKPSQVDVRFRAETNFD
jgi:hypothetical protein